MFFTLAKIGWLLVAPSHLLVWLTLAGLFRRGLALAAAALWLAVAVLPVGAWIAAPLEDRYRAATGPVDGIVVLGGAVDDRISLARGRVEVNGAADRLTETVALARANPSARVVFSGGSGRLFPDAVTEGDLIGPFLIGLGVDPARLTVERESRDTFENAQLTRTLVDPKPGERWLLVTSALHMPRAMAAFSAAGFSVVPWPVDYRTAPGDDTRLDLDLPRHLMLLDAAVHEWVGLLAYRLAGRIGT